MLLKPRSGVKIHAADRALVSVGNSRSARAEPMRENKVGCEPSPRLRSKITEITRSKLAFALQTFSKRPMSIRVHGSSLPSISESIAQVVTRFGARKARGERCQGPDQGILPGATLASHQR